MQVAFATLSFLLLFVGSYAFTTFKLIHVAYLFAAVVALSIIFLDYQVALFFVFIYVGVEGAAKIVSGYNPVIHVGVDLLIGLLLIKITVDSIRGKRVFKTKPPLLVLFSLHFIWFALTILNPYALSLFASLAGLKIYGPIMLLYFFGYYFTNSLKDARGYIVCWFIIALVQVVVGLYQAYVGPSSVTSISPYYGTILFSRIGHYAFRPFGLGSGPGMPAVFVVMVASFAVYIALFSKSITLRILSLVSMPAFVAILIFCQVRAAIIKSAIAVFLFLLLSAVKFRTVDQVIKRRIFKILAISTVFGAVAVPSILGHFLESYDDNQRALERSMSVFDLDTIRTGRRGGWDRFWKYLSWAPLGAGLSRTGSAANKFQDELKKDNMFRHMFFTDNMFIAIVVDLGIPGLLIILTLIGNILISSIRSIYREQYGESVMLQGAILISLFSVLIGAYGSEAILYNPEAAFFWFFSGVLMKIRSIHVYAEQSGTANLAEVKK